MKEIELVNGDKMVFESGHKAFDRQTNIITTGNIIANTVFGNHIRPFFETECNGLTWEEGHLRDFDLRGSTGRELRRWPRILEYVKAMTYIRGIWLYVLFHYNQERRIIHGFVATTYEHEPLMKWIVGPTYKSYDVVYEAAKYLEDRDEKIQ